MEQNRQHALCFRHSAAHVPLSSRMTVAFLVAVLCFLEFGRVRPILMCFCQSWPIRARHFPQFIGQQRATLGQSSAKFVHRPHLAQIGKLWPNGGNLGQRVPGIAQIGHTAAKLVYAACERQMRRM